MISGDFLYNGMNLLLAAVALMCIFLAPKLLGAGGARRKLVGACILLILSGAIFSVSLRMFRLSTLAYFGEAVQRAEAGTYQMTDNFKNIALVGNVFDLAAVILLAGVSRSLLRREKDSGSEKEGA
jgi:hypothetical protein